MAKDDDDPEEKHEHDWRPLRDLDTRKTVGVHCASCGSVAMKEE